METRGGRLRVEVRDRGAVDEARLGRFAWAWTGDRIAHLLPHRPGQGSATH
jgi:hypothetical protein